MSNSNKVKESVQRLREFIISVFDSGISGDRLKGEKLEEKDDSRYQDLCFFLSEAFCFVFLKKEAHLKKYPSR